MTGNVNLDTTAAATGDVTISYAGTSVTINIDGTGTGSGGGGSAVKDDINAKLAGTAFDGVLTASEDASHQLVLTGPAATDGTISVSGTGAAAFFGTTTPTVGSDAKYSPVIVC